MPSHSAYDVLNLDQHCDEVGDSACVAWGPYKCSDGEAELYHKATFYVKHVQRRSSGLDVLNLYKVM
jgi:hypothetical protein